MTAPMKHHAEKAKFKKPASFMTREESINWDRLYSDVVNIRLLCINTLPIDERKDNMIEINKIFFRLHNGERSIEIKELAEKEVESLRQMLYVNNSQII